MSGPFRAVDGDFDHGAASRHTEEQLVRDLVRQLRDTQQYAYSIEAEYRYHNAPPYHSAVSSRNYKRTEALLDRAEAWLANDTGQRPAASKGEDHG